MKTKISLIFFISFISALILIMLFNFTKMPNERKNGFTRRWIRDSFKQTNQTSFKEPLRNICGLANNHIYLTVPNPQWVIQIDKTLKTKDTILFPIKLRDELITSHNLVVDSPFIYLFANNAFKLYKGQMSGKKVDNINKRVDSINLLTSLFSRSLFISPSSAILRSFDSTFKKQIFEKIDIRTGKVLKQNDIIEDTKDAGLSTDGKFAYNSDSHRIFFVESYSNNFVCLDTNLNFIYKSNTIDTTKSNLANIDTVKLKEANRIQPGIARIVVNKTCSAGNKFLFIESGLKADNESAVSFNSNSIVDLYQINNGDYSGSIYIPNIEQEKMRKILITNDNQLIALYKTHIAMYQLK